MASQEEEVSLGAGGGCLGVIELLLGEVDGYGVNCICKLESHL